MVYIVFFGICGPGDVSATDRATQARPPLPKVRLIFFPAVALPLLFGVLILQLGQRGYIKETPDSFFGPDPNAEVSTGEDARRKIVESARRELPFGAAKPELPTSASDVWLFEDGSFSCARPTGRSVAAALKSA